MRCFALLLLSFANGCYADAKLARLQMKLGDHLERNEDPKALEVEQTIEKVASNEWGPASIELQWQRGRMAETYSDWLRTDHSTAIAASVLQNLERQYGASDQRIVTALVPLANAHLCARRWNEAGRIADRLTSICNTPATRTDVQFGCKHFAVWDIDSIYMQAGEYRQSVASYIDVDELMAGSPDRHGGVMMLTIIARRLVEGGFYPEALWYLERCVAESRPSFQRAASSETVWSTPEGDVKLDVLDSAHSFESQAPRCLEDLIALRTKLGDAEEAEKLSRWQRDLWNHGPDLEKELRERAAFTDRTWHVDWSTSRDYHTLGFYYAGKGRFADAANALEEAVRLLASSRTSDDRQRRCGLGWLLVEELLDLGAAYDSLSRYDLAQQVYRRAEFVAELELNPQHESRLEPVARLAAAQQKAGSFTDAKRSWRRYLAKVEGQRGKDHADYAFGLIGLAETLEASGDASGAAASRRSAAAIRAKVEKRIEGTRDLPLPVALRSSPPPAN